MLMLPRRKEPVEDTSHWYDGLLGSAVGGLASLIPVVGPAIGGMAKKVIDDQTNPQPAAEDQQPQMQPLMGSQTDQPRKRFYQRDGLAEVMMNG